MSRLRANFLTGTTTDAPLASGDTSFHSPALASMQVVSAPDYMAVSLDPFAVNGAPEIVWVTDHASGATVATISRHEESTLARSHPAGTEWANALTALDFNDLYAEMDQVAASLGDYLPLSGGAMLGLLAMSGPPTADLHAATKAYVDGLVGTGDFLPLAGGTMTGHISFGTNPTSASHLVRKGYCDTKAESNHNHSGVYAPVSHTHPYAATSHSHTGAVWNTLTVGALTLTSDLNGSMTASEISAASCLFNNATLGNVAVTGYVSTDELRPRALWPYHGGSNGSLRWIGIGSDIAQNHTSSADEYKRLIDNIDLEKAIFSRLDPIFFRYRDDHPFKERWADDSFEVYENPESIGRMGFSYEQVQQLAPHWTYETDGMKAIGFDAMMPDFMAWTVASIKDMQRRLVDAGI